VIRGRITEVWFAVDLERRSTGQDRVRSIRLSRMESEQSPYVVLQMDEERLWSELYDLVVSLPPDRVDLAGYFTEGWSAKDLIGHVGSWLAEAGVVLERIRFGTYRRSEIDIDAMNAAFYAALHDVAFLDVKAQAISARYRMLRAWRSLPKPSVEADRWIAKAGPGHYAEHLPRLRDWVLEIG
jgi:hypothetical protein